jgi:Peptidase family M23
MGTNSSGVYRIPYYDGTPVRCTADDTTHSPPNRIDLTAQGDDRFNLVVATGDGIVRLIVDNFCENRPGLDPCNNNYVWIEHSNGEWTKYSHMIRNSVRRGAGVSEGLRVRAGRILGIEGDVGCADGQHLHFEVAELGADSAAARNPVDCKAASNPIGCDGVLKDKSRNRVPVISNVPLNKFEEGEEYVVPIRRAVLLSASEIKFGPVRPTERARRTLTIKNTWGADIAVTLSDPIGNIFAWIPVHHGPWPRMPHECRPRLFCPFGRGVPAGHPHHHHRRLPENGQAGGPRPVHPRSNPLSYVTFSIPIPR